MPAVRRLVVAILLIVAVAALAPGVGAFPAPPRPGADDPTVCPVTIANGQTPPGEAPNALHHGNGDLWVALRAEGRAFLSWEDVRPDGSLAGKFPWWRGVNGDLTIEGQRLDARAAAMRAEIPDGYAALGFQPSGLIFATEGCWQVTANVGDAWLTFVTRVVKLDG